LEHFFARISNDKVLKLAKLLRPWTLRHGWFRRHISQSFRTLRRDWDTR